jgi:hypothetical protein
MAPFTSLLRRTAPAALPFRAARCLGSRAQTAAEPEAGWTFYHSSDELLSGLDVMEHTAPPALLELLREALAA